MQQSLPFTVLKQFEDGKNETVGINMLQQSLPFTVLKQEIILTSWPVEVATVLTVYGIETPNRRSKILPIFSCNSPYRLRY